VVDLSTGDVTSGLPRPLAAEIAKPLLMTNQRSHITRERCAIDRNLVLNTNRKPWSIRRLVTSLPVSDVTEHVNDVRDVKAGENWRITWKLQDTAEKCQQITNSKSGSDYSLKTFSLLVGASLAAEPNNRT
jgi:hypothetical protein